MLPPLNADPEYHEAAAASAADRMRRLGVALARPFAALLFPDREVPAAVRSGRYRFAMAIVIASALASAIAIGIRIDVTRDVLAQNAGPGGGGPGAQPAGGPMQPPEPKSDREIDEEIAKQTDVVRVKLGLQAALGTPALILALGLGLFALGRYVGGKPSVRSTIIVATHAALPWAVRSVIAAAAAWRQPVVLPDQIDKLVSPGWFGFVPVNPILAKLATGVDIFTLWSVVIAGFGLAAAANIRRTKSFVVVAIGFVLYLLVTQLIAGGGGGPPAEVP